jgi:HEAT repeat protein
MTSVSGTVEERVVLSLARTPKPTKEATEALKAVLKRSPYHAGALYGLGTHCRLYRDDGKKKDAAELGEFLAARFKPENGPMTNTILLRAIANSGYVGALPRVLPFFKDTDEGIRATAVRALQSMHDQRIDGMIAERIKEDKSAEVRTEAIEAAKVREPSQPLVMAIVDAGIHSDSPYVRYKAVEVMGDWLKKRPDLRATLDLVAKNDEEEKIRARAKAAL